MNAKEFVSNWKLEKERLAAAFMDPDQTSVGRQIHDLNLSAQQLEKMRSILDEALTDTMYTLLLALDGEASLGTSQRTFTIHDEEGKPISAPGDIEAEAWEQFHGQG